MEGLAELITALAGLILAVLFEYFPGLARWYNAKEDNLQRLIMIGMLVLATAGLYGVSALGWYDIFPVGDIKTLVMSFLFAITINQSTHRLLLKKKAK